METTLNNVNAAATVETTEQSSKLVPIYTVPTPTPAGMHALEYSRRSTDKNPVAQSERYRVAFIPEELRLVSAEGMASKFHALVQARIDELAKQRFEAMCKAEGPMLAAIDPRAFTVDSLLMYAAEERERSRITKESMLAWLTSSATFASLSDAGKKLWQARVPGILAPMFKNAFTRNEANSILAKLHNDDMSDPHCVLLANRLSIIAEAASIEDSF